MSGACLSLKIEGLPLSVSNLWFISFYLFIYFSDQTESSCFRSSVGDVFCKGTKKIQCVSATYDKIVTLILSNVQNYLLC